MAPDDPSGIRELKFKHGDQHVLVTADPDGSGYVRVLNDFFQIATGYVRHAALKATLKMLSIARKIVFEEFIRGGGTVEELQKDDP